MKDTRCGIRASGCAMRATAVISHLASRISHRLFGLALPLGLVLAAAAGQAAEVGPAVEVASKAEGTRYQTWASAAWSEGAKAWLVAWREGYLNEPETGSDIWCGRVSADPSTGSGQAVKVLDPAGIRLTKGKGLKDRPRVASDGKGWLVVWEDLSNGKDWDVRGSLRKARPSTPRGYSSPAALRLAQGLTP
jgi:hypothetical protein